MMMGGDDDIPEKIKAMADIPPPPPPPGSPLKSPNTPLIARGDLNVASPDNDSDRLLSPPLLLEIEEGTPAAEALKANADVRVSKLRKVGRSTRLQAGVRVLKSAARTASGQPGHAGDRRGAPAFVAPRGSTVTISSLATGQPPPTIPEVDDEGDSDHGEGRLKTSIIADAVAEGGPSLEVGLEGHSVGDDSASQQSNQDKSINSDDSSPDRNKELHVTQSAAPVTTVESLWLAQQPFQKHSSQRSIPHMALPAAIAAACRAGEEMDRQRATQIEHSNIDGGGLSDTGFIQKSYKNLPNLFKSTDKLPGVDGDDNASPTRITPRPKKDRLTSSLTLPHAHPHAVFRRSSMEHIHSMPSEISVADTEKHSNLRQADIQEIIEDLSDDDEILPTEVTGEAPSHVQIKKHVQVDPIVVEIPGSNRPVTFEETKEEEFADEEEVNREASMAKAKKKMSIRGTKKKGGIDDEAFHFHGPRSVRKWVNRRRTKEESKEIRSYVKGKVIDGKHELYTMSIAVMFGMRTSIGRTNLAMSQTAHNELRWLDNNDMMAVEKYEFPPRVGVSNSKF